MELPQSKALPHNYRQEHAMMTAIAWVMDKGYHEEIENPGDLASDILRELHNMGFMVVACPDYEQLNRTR